MKIKLIRLEELSKEETFYIIGGQINPAKKKERKVRRVERNEKEQNEKLVEELVLTLQIHQKTTFLKFNL